MKVAVLLSGCGVYDGAEIHESVLTLLALNKHKLEVQCIAPNIVQHHVVNHLTGEEMNEQRNVMVEAARIARGDVQDIAQVKAEDFSALVIPGGFGVAKNFTKWAFQGPDGDILPSVKNLIRSMLEANKPIVAMCMAPTVLAKAFEGTPISAKLTVGSTSQASPYDIAAISGGMEKVGAKAVMCSVTDVVVDDNHDLITSPCYMMEASISEIFVGIEKSIAKLVEVLELAN